MGSDLISTDLISTDLSSIPRGGTSATAARTDAARADAHSSGLLFLGLPNVTAPQLTLLVDGCVQSAAPWLAGAASLCTSLSHSPPVRLVAVAPPEGDVDGVEALAAAYSSTPTFMVRVVRDPCGGWESKREVGSGGALLVRPDGHIAWRCEQLCAAVEEHGGNSADQAAAAEQLLADALEQVLMLQPTQGTSGTS